LIQLRLIWVIFIKTRAQLFKMIIKQTKVTKESIEIAAQNLIDGRLVAFPTETVYGLGANANDQTAINRIYKVKGRPSNHPLIVHISSLTKLSLWTVDVPTYAQKLAEIFWPGPMTLLLKRSNLAQNFITGNQETVGIRVPNHPVALKLLENFESLGGNGVAAPSANRFGAVSPTVASDVIEELSEFLNSTDLILDGGPCKVGLESTIIDCTGSVPVILRSGAITVDMINNLLKIDTAKSSEKSNIRVPGKMESHYSPKAAVFIDTLPVPGDGLIAMSDILTPPGVIRLAAPISIEEYAKNFYQALRLGDKKGLKSIKVIQPAGAGLADAIRDRLSKAAFK